MNPVMQKINKQKTTKKEKKNNGVLWGWVDHRTEKLGISELRFVGIWTIILSHSFFIFILKYLH